MSIELFIIFILVLGVSSQNILYECSFTGALNSNTCPGGITISATGLPTNGLVQNDNIPGITPLLYVTDFLSITNPTSGSTESCKIPFTYNGRDTYFCTLLSGTNYVCETPSGTLNTCNRGFYLRAKSATGGAAFTATITFNSAIDLPPTGKYRLNFYTYINCPRVECDSANEAIVIKKREDGAAATDYKEIFRTGFENNRIRDLQWTEENIYFEPETTKINLRIELVRQTAVANVQGFLAIDEIKLFHEDEATSTIIPSASQSIMTITTTPSTTVSATTPISITEITTSTTIISTTTLFFNNSNKNVNHDHNN